jgi:DNA-binding CsgD family transcriptional regulator/ArsR family metal-binding transcriptional regulator
MEYCMSGFNGFYNFSLRSSSIKVDERCWFAHFKLDGDFSPLFPFIQSTASEAVHYESPEYVQFQMDHITCALYPPDIVVARLFDGREQALEFAQRLMDYLNELELHKAQLRPIHKKLSRLHIPEILRLLPMTSCGECGFQTCMAFAGAVSRRKARLNMCGYFPEPVSARIIFSVTDPRSGKIRSIEVDSELAGFTISRIDGVQSGSRTERASAKRMKHSPAVTGSRDGVIFRISGREAEVLRLITEGFTNKEIAQVLKVSHNTVKSHVLHIFNKLGINDRTQAAVWAAQNELV